MLVEELVAVFRLVFLAVLLGGHRIVEQALDAVGIGRVEADTDITIGEDIAIIGMSCRFPGAENVDQFWENLLNGVDSVREIPADRWDIERFYSAEREPGNACIGGH